MLQSLGALAEMLVVCLVQHMHNAQTRVCYHLDLSTFFMF